MCVPVGDYELTRARLRDGRETTVYVVHYPRASTNVRLICFPEPRRLDVWCAEHDQPEAIVAGFFVRDPYRPLGDVRVGGAAVTHEPIQAPWGARRAAIHIDGDMRLAARSELADEPAGDLVTAGPMLVEAGRSLVDGQDREGFSAGASQFDSDITAERHPRCALGLSRTEMLAVACDGRRTRGRRGGRPRRARSADDRPRLRGRDQPRRWRLCDARPPGPSAQPALSSVDQPAQSRAQS